MRAALWCYFSAGFFAAGCSSPVAEPGGFPLTLQMQGVGVYAIESLRITISAIDEGGAAHAFGEIEPISEADGAITIDDFAGDLVITVTGEYVRANAEDADAAARFTLPIWSEDPVMRMVAPRVTAEVLQAGMVIASGNGYLPRWPPPIDFRGSYRIAVRCHSDAMSRCEVGSVGDGGVPIDAGPGQLRLAPSGMLEIFHDGRWGPICDDGFGTEEAQVACRQLGSSGVASFSTITGPTAAFWLDDVMCTGSERSLEECMHSPWGVHNCTPAEAQAVQCL